MLGAEEKANASDSAEQEEQQTLGQKLADETRFLRSQSLANRDLTTPQTGAGKQEIGDVDATDQEDQPYRAEQQNERLANAANNGFAERNEANGPCGLCRILRRILFFQRFHQRVQMPRAAAIDSPGIKRAMTTRLLKRESRSGGGNGTPGKASA